MAEGDSSAEKPLPDGTTDPLVGKVLDGRFAVTELIGCGGMGRIYKAVQKPLERVVALKVLNPNYESQKDPAFLTRFMHEAELTAKLKHPNTITVHDYGKTEDGIYYIAMEFLEGVTLADVIEREGALPIPRALHITAQICKSLREAHKAGLMHRDLKPANVMLLHEDGDPDRVKVLDFGLVKPFQPAKRNESRPDDVSLTQAGVVMGSPLYMAPEQARARTDPRSDIYSLGVMLFEMLTGKPPFDSKSSIDVIVKHLNEVPPRLRKVRPELEFPPEIEALVARALEKKPEERFQTMDEVLEAIRETGLAGGLSGFNPLPRSGTGSVARASTVPPSEQETRAAELPPDVGSPRRKLRPELIAFVAAAAMVVVLGALVLLQRRSGPAPVAEPRPSEPVVVQEDGPPPPPVEPAPVARPVTFRIESEPLGAQVFRGDELLGKTPLEVDAFAGSDGLARGEFTLVLEGYGRATVSASGQSGQVLVKERLRKKTPIKKKPPRDGYKEDPYQ